VLWLTAAVFAVVLPGFLLLSRDGPRELAALGALASLYMLNSSALNQFGPDGPAYWVNVAAGGSSRADLVGKNLALALPGFALVAVVSIALSAVGGGWVYLPVTLCLAAGILGIILGVANYVSIRFPFALSNVSSNVWASQGAGAGCAIGLVQLLAMAVEGALMLPLGILLVVGLVAWPPALAILCPLAVAYGYTLWRLGVGLGTEWLDAHQPELRREVDGDLDVVGLALQGVGEAVHWHPPGDQATEPVAVGPCQGVGGLLVVAPVGVDRADDHVVAEHQLAVERAGVHADRAAARRHASQADDPVRRQVPGEVEDQLPDAGALDGHVGVTAGLLHRAVVVDGAEVGDQARLGARW
jgi:hypothetical protein